MNVKLLKNLMYKLPGMRAGRAVDSLGAKVESGEGNRFVNRDKEKPLTALSWDNVDD